MNPKTGDLCRLKPRSQRRPIYSSRGELVLILGHRPVPNGTKREAQYLVYRFKDELEDNQPNPDWLYDAWLYGLYEVVG